MLSDLARKLYGEKFLTFTFLTVTNALTTGLTIAKFFAPRNLTITDIGFVSGTQVSGVLKVEARNAAGTVLASTGTSATGNHAAANALVSKGDLVSIVAVGAADTDDYTDVTVVLQVEPDSTDA